MIDFYHSNIVLFQGTFVALLVALSVQVPIRAGVFSFAGVASYGIGGYTSAIAVIHWKWKGPQAVFLGVLFALAFSALLGIVLQRMSGLYLGMATIAAVLIAGVIANNGGKLTGGPNGLYGALTGVGIGQLALSTLVIILLVAWSERGRLGRRIDVVREDPELARSVGVRVPAYRFSVFLASGAIGAIAGGFDTLIRSTINPTNLGFNTVTLALTVIIVGGVRSWLGSAIGAIIVTWLPSITQTAQQWQLVFYGGLIVLAAIFVPGGVLGTFTTLWRKLESRRTSSEVAYNPGSSR